MTSCVIQINFKYKIFILVNCSKNTLQNIVNNWLNDWLFSVAWGANSNTIEKKSFHNIVNNWLKSQSGAGEWKIQIVKYNLEIQLWNTILWNIQIVKDTILWNTVKSTFPNDWLSWRANHQLGSVTLNSFLSHRLSADC